MSTDIDRISLATVALPVNITQEISDVSSRPIGYGGYSDIYTGIWRSAHGEMKVAIKVVRAIPGTEEMPRALRREISVWKRLQHRNIHVMCGLYEGYGPAPALVSPWYEHGNVKSYLRRHVNDPDVDDLKLRLLCDIMCGVTFLHNSSIVHGDIKGDNVLISDAGVARLCDFGLSRLLIEHSQSMTHTGVRGTSRWMAPEIFLDGEEPSYASDVWACGCLVIEVWLDVLPYQTSPNDYQLSIALSEEDLPGSPSDMPEMTWTVVETCCNFDAAQRPSPLHVCAHISLSLTINRVLQMVMLGRPIDAIGSTLLSNVEASMLASDPQNICELYTLPDAELATEVVRLLAIWSLSAGRSPMFHPSIFRWYLAKLGISNIRLPAGVSILDVDDNDFASEFSGLHNPAELRPLARLVERALPGQAKLFMTQFGTAALGPPFKFDTLTHSVAWLPDGIRVVAGFCDPGIRVLGTATGATLHRLVGHQATQGTLLVSRSNDLRIIWDSETGHVIGGLLVVHTNVRSVAFSPDSPHIVSGSSDGTIRVWSTDTCTTVLGPLYGHVGIVYCVAYSPDASRIVSGSWDETVRVWDSRTGALILTLIGHTGWVRSVAYSPNGLRIVSASIDHTVRIWDATTGRPVGIPLRGHSDWVWSVAYSPDGKRIVSSSFDRTIRIWSNATGDPIATIRGHTEPVYSVAFSPDGARLTSGSFDRTVRIWDATDEWTRWDF